MITTTHHFRPQQQQHQLQHYKRLPTLAAKYCDEYVCLTVCPLAYLENHTVELYKFFSASCLWPGLCPLMYFRFCGWRHVFTKWPYGVSCVLVSSKSVTAESTASIPTKFCSAIKISKCTSWWVAHQGQSLLSTIALFLFSFTRVSACPFHRMKGPTSQQNRSSYRIVLYRIVDVLRRGAA